MPKITKFLDQRVNTKRLGGVADRMKAEDIAGNTKMLENIVTKDAENLIKEVQRSNGVRLSPEDAKSIIISKLKKLHEECK